LPFLFVQLLQRKQDSKLQRKATRENWSLDTTMIVLEASGLGPRRRTTNRRRTMSHLLKPRLIAEYISWDGVWQLPIQHGKVNLTMLELRRSGETAVR
jgi:hypothetical protein